jgi:hypothetical protein
MDWFPNPIASLGEMWADENSVDGAMYWGMMTEVVIVGFALTAILAFLMSYFGEDDDTVLNTVAGGLLGSVVIGFGWFFLMPLAGFLLSCCVVFVVIALACDGLRAVGKRRRSGAKKRQRTKRMSRKDRALAKQAAAEKAEQDARRLQRQELARQTRFQLASALDLTPPKKRLARGSVPDVDVLFMIPEVLLDRPVRQAVARSGLSVSRQPASLAGRPEVSFPDAEVNADGVVTSYGRTAILYGVAQPELPVHDDPQPDQLEAQPLGWMVPQSHRK